MPKTKTMAYYRGEEIVGADPETFEVVELIGSTFYAKDKHQVYFQNEKIDGFDAPTFRILEKTAWFPIFLADKNKVAIGKLSEKPSADSIYKFEVKDIDGADPNTFVIQGGMWGKDSRRVYYGTQVVAEADAETFEVLGMNSNDFNTLLYAVDENNVYYSGKRIEGADVASFRIIKDVTLISGSFGEDIRSAYKDGEMLPKQDLRSFQAGKIPSSAKNLGNNYYLYRDNIYHYSSSTQAAAYFGLLYVQYIPERALADAATFEVLKNGYARDKEYVYYEGNKLTHDPDRSFEILTLPYTKTNNAVFLHQNVIEGALSDSFQILSLGYTNDAKTVFYGDRKVHGADPRTFKVLGQGTSLDEAWGGGWAYYDYGRDAKNIFCSDVILTDADPETFILKGRNRMPQDKNHSFDGCDIKE